MSFEIQFSCDFSAIQYDIIRVITNLKCCVGRLALFVDGDFSLLVNDCGITVIYYVYMVEKAQAIVNSNSQLYHYMDTSQEDAEMCIMII